MSLMVACGLFALNFEVHAQASPPSPPRVNAVYVDSSSWASAFKSNLAAIGIGSATHGYQIPTAYNSVMRSDILPHQLKYSPWKDIDTIHVAFSENVQITASDFAIKGVNADNNEVVYSGTFNYNSTTHVATWTTATAFERNKLLVIVSGEVRSQATGVKLAGGWTNPDPSVPRNGSVFPSGGSPGETFFFRTNILPGAAHRSVMIGFASSLIVRNADNSSIGDSAYTPFADFTGDGQISDADSNFLSSVYGSSLPSNEPTLTMPPSTTALACTGDCYADSARTTAGEAQGPGGVMMEYVFANGTDGFKIWKEQGGSRILNSSGLIANGWQRRLDQAGTNFTAQNFTDASVVGGRACPPNVFLDHSNMTATDRCLYYDNGNAKQALTKDSGTEAVDYLNYWTSANTGRGGGQSYYEGNIKTCNTKGMRLPTIYEASINNPASSAIQLPTGDGISPVWAGTEGVPSMPYWTWTASANPWSGHYARNRIYHMWSGSSGSCDYWGCMDPARADYVRCVLPSSSFGE